MLTLVASVNEYPTCGALAPVSGCGSVVRWGARHGVATPVNATLVACIKGIERAMADRQNAGSRV